MVRGKEPRSVAQQEIDLLQLFDFCGNFLLGQPGFVSSVRKKERLLQGGQSAAVCCS